MPMDTKIFLNGSACSRQARTDARAESLRVYREVGIAFEFIEYSLELLNR